MTIDLRNEIQFEGQGELMQGLGSYWNTVFGDRHVINTLMRAAQDMRRQSDIDTWEVVKGSSIMQAPVYHTQVWYRHRIYKDQQTDGNLLGPKYQPGGQQYGDGTQYGVGDPYLWMYELPETLIRPRAICNRVSDASAILYEGAGYYFAPGYIGLPFNPFASDLWPTTETDDGQAVDFWFYLSDWDYQLLQRRYALAIGVNAPSSEDYRKFLEGVWQGRLLDRGRSALYKILEGASGVPLAQADEAVIHAFSDDEYSYVITATRVYRVLRTTILVTVGDQLYVGQSLFESLILTNQQDWDGYDITLPPSFFEPTIGIRHPITFPNDDVPVTYLGQDDEGRTLYHFTLYGEGQDLINYRQYLVENNFVRALDKRGSNRQTQPGASELVSTVNPAIDIIAQLVVPNLMLAVVDQNLWSTDNGLQAHLEKEIRKFVPPHSRLLIQQTTPLESESWSSWSSLSEGSESSSTVGSTLSTLSSPSSTSSSLSSSSKTSTSSSSRSLSSISSSTFTESSQSSSSETSFSSSTPSSSTSVTESSRSSRSKSSSSLSTRSSLSSRSESSNSSSSESSSSTNTLSTSTSSESTEATSSSSSSTETSSSTVATTGSSISSSSSTIILSTSSSSRSSFTETQSSRSESSRSESSISQSPSSQSSGSSISTVSSASESSASEQTNTVSSESSISTLTVSDLSASESSGSESSGSESSFTLSPSSITSSSSSTPQSLQSMSSASSRSESSRSESSASESTNSSNSSSSTGSSASSQSESSSTSSTLSSESSESSTSSTLSSESSESSNSSISSSTSTPSSKSSASSISDYSSQSSISSSTSTPSSESSISEQSTPSTSSTETSESSVSSKSSSTSSTLTSESTQSDLSTSSSSNSSPSDVSSSSSISSHSQGDFYLTGDLILNGDFEDHVGSSISDWDDNGNYLASYDGYSDVARLTPAANVISQDVNDNPLMDISGYADAIETGNVHLELKADIHSTQDGIDNEEIKIQVAFVGGGINKTTHTIVADVADVWSSVTAVLPVDTDADEFRVVCRTDFFGDTGYFDNIEARLLDLNNMTSSTTESTSSTVSEQSTSSSSESSASSSLSSTESSGSSSSVSDVSTSSTLSTESSESSISRSFSSSSSSSSSLSSSSQSDVSTSSESGLSPLFLFETDLGESRSWGGSPTICSSYWADEDTLEDDTANDNDGMYYRQDAGGSPPYEYGILFPSVVYNILEWELKGSLTASVEEIAEMGDAGGNDSFLAVTYDDGTPEIQIYLAWNGHANSDSLSSEALSGGEMIRIEFDASAKTIELFVDDVSQGTVDASDAVDNGGYTTLDDFGPNQSNCVEIPYYPDGDGRKFVSVAGYYDAGLT